MDRKAMYWAMFGVIIGLVGIIGYFAENKVANHTPTFHSVAEKWCKANDGKFDNGVYAHKTYAPECKVELYKGAAGISAGQKTYQFFYEIVDYDTGRSVVQVRHKLEYVENGFKEKELEYIGEFITKGKYN